MQEIPTTNPYVLAEHRNITTIEKKLESTAPEHGPGTPWRKLYEQKLADAKQRLKQHEALELAQPWHTPPWRTFQPPSTPVPLVSPASTKKPA